MSKSKKEIGSAKLPDDKGDQNKPGNLPGWPGFRTRDGRSGYDPIDTRTEAAHTFGSFIRTLFSRQLRIKNPVFLLGAGILGFVLIFPLILAISELMNGNSFAWDAWFYLIAAGILGLAFLINFIINLVRYISK